MMKGDEKTNLLSGYSPVVKRRFWHLHVFGGATIWVLTTSRHLNGKCCKIKIK